MEGALLMPLNPKRCLAMGTCRRSMTPSPKAWFPTTWAPAIEGQSGGTTHWDSRTNSKPGIKKWGKSDEDVDEAPGFVNRDDKDKSIKLRLPGKYKVPATFEAAIHETVHLNSAFNGKQNVASFRLSSETITTIASPSTSLRRFLMSA
jgi:hypothetical protein